MNDSDFIRAMRATLGPLAFLSLQHPARHAVPTAPTNEERMRAYRNILPVLPGNNYGWRFRQAR